MPITATDVSVATSGNIRWTGDGTTNYTVLELHRFLQDLADDEQASGDDLVDITTDTPSVRSTDNIIALQGSFNIDDTMARHLYAGSISQSSGDTLYSGARFLGPNETGTQIMVVQDDKILPAWWGTGVNANAAQNITNRILIKTRVGGADIDGKRVITKVREFGDQYKEFAVTLGVGESVSALANGDDLNATTADATVEGWSTIAVTEGFQLVDINNDGTDEEYYQQWDRGSQTLNDTYEYTKWIQQRAHVTDSGTDTGSNFIVDDATTTGQGQEFTARVNDEKLMEMRFDIKIGAGAPTGPLTAELWLSDDAGAGLAEPTGAVLATSEPVLASLIRSNSTYQEVIFRFNDNVTMTGGEKYFAVIRHANGDASNYFHVDGSTSGADDGNRASDASGVWTATAADDLKFTVKSSPIIHGRPGELWRGITQEIVYDTGAGTATEDEILFWGTTVTYDTLSGSFNVGEYVVFDNAGTKVNGGKVLKDSGTVLTVALEDISGATLADGYNITGLDSGATANINVTINDQDKGGGEGVLYALDDNTGTGDLYIQLISGVKPVDNLQIEGRSSGFTCLVNATVTDRTINPEALGQSTGSNIIGAYGIVFQTTDVGASDLFTALDNVARNPPNNVTITVTGLVSGEDRVLVAPRTGTAIQFGQMTTDTTLTTSTETIVSIATVAVPTDTPNTGIGTASNTRLRVELDNGVYYRLPYDSYDSATPGNFTLGTPVNSAVQIDVDSGALTFTRASGSFLDDGFEPGCTFTGSNFANGGNNAQFTAETVTATVITVTAAGGMVTETGSGDEVLTSNGWDFTAAGAGYSKADTSTSGNNVFVAYIDVLANAATEAYTAVYNTDRDIFVRVRDGGGTPIVTFENTAATFGSSSSSIPATRQSDA